MNNMKKLFITLAAAAFTLLLCLCASATEFATVYEAPFAKDPITLDGRIEDAYYAAAPIPIASPQSGVSMENHSTGTAYILYDESYLYAALDIADSTPCGSFGTNGTSVSAYDGTLFAFNFTGGAAKVSYDGTAAGYAQYNVTGRGTSNARHQVKYNEAGEQIGYTIELRIPLPEATYILKEGKISFAIWLYDYAWDGTTTTNNGICMTHPAQQTAYASSPGFPGPMSSEGAWDGVNLGSMGLRTVLAGEEGLTVDGVADAAYRYATVGTAGDKATFRTAWDAGNLYLLCEVNDTTQNAEDAVTFYVDWDRIGGALTSGGQNGSVTVTRAGAVSVSGSAMPQGGVSGCAVETDSGYTVEIKVPLGTGFTGEKFSRFYLGAVSVCDNGTTFPEGGVSAADSSAYTALCLSQPICNLRVVKYGQTIISYDEVPVNATLTLPQAAAQNGRAVVGWVSDGSHLYAPQSTVTIGSGNTVFTLVTADMRALSGASVRLTDEAGAGLRFAAAISKADFDALYQYAPSVRVGALIASGDELEATAMTHQALAASGVSFCDVTDTGFVSGIGSGTEYGWYAALQNIDLNRSTDRFVCMPYLAYQDANGQTVLVYAENTASASVYEIAYPAYEDRGPAYPHATSDGVNSPYTAAALLNLKNRLDCSYVVGPKADGSFGPVLPATLTESKYYTPSFEATVRGNLLTLYLSTAGLMDDVQTVNFCGRKLSVTPASGAALVDITVDTGFDAIRVNQVGYRTDSIKRAIVTNGGNYFWLVNANTGDLVYVGSVELGSYEELAGEVVNYCDFTAFKTPGTYYLMVDADMEHPSYPFTIGDDVYNDITALALKCYYYNRCGMAITGDWAPGANHAACHLGNARVLEFYGATGSDGSRATRETGEVVTDVAGGWHDAGDYGRYTNWEAPSVAKMMIAYRLRPSLFGDNTGIPESGNGVPDILDEAYYTLTWLLKMQRSDGAVYHKLTSAQHAGGVAPENDNNQFYLFPVSVESTASFAGALSMAYRVYQDINPTFANQCLAAAQAAYTWAKANASVVGKYPYKDGSGTGIGNSSNLNHELSFAAESLWQSTGEQSYYNDFADYIRVATNTSDAAQLCAVYDFAVGDGLAPEEDVLTLLKDRYNSRLQQEVDKYNSTAYEFSLTISSYANQSLVGTDAAILLGDLLNGNEDHRWLAEENANYILGKNGTGYCGMLGVGTQQIQNPHLRFPTPGWVTGGACSYSALASRFASFLENETRITPDTPPLKCYLDEYVYFYLNEPTISTNANALLTFTLLSKS